MNKEDVLKTEYCKLIANPEKVYAQNPSIIQAAHTAMEIYATECMINLLENMSTRPVSVYSIKGPGKDREFYIGQQYKDKVTKELKSALKAELKRKK